MALELEPLVAPAAAAAAVDEVERPLAEALPVEEPERPPDDVEPAPADVPAAEWVAPELDVAVDVDIETEAELEPPLVLELPGPLVEPERLPDDEDVVLAARSASISVAIANRACSRTEGSAAKLLAALTTTPSCDCAKAPSPSWVSKCRYS